LRAIEIKEKEEKWVDAAFLYGELAGLCEEQGRSDQAYAYYAKAHEISLGTDNKWLQNQTSLDVARIRRRPKQDQSTRLGSQFERNDLSHS
jgi:hypothetical protein